MTLANRFRSAKHPTSLTKRVVNLLHLCPHKSGASSDISIGVPRYKGGLGGLHEAWRDESVLPRLYI